MATTEASSPDSIFGLRPPGALCEGEYDQEFRWPLQRSIPTDPHTLPEGTVLVSSDSHVAEPMDWADRMPAKFKDRAPREWYDEDGFFHFHYDDRDFPIHGLDPCIQEGRPGIRDMDARIQDLDAEGVSKDLMFPQKAFALVAGIQQSHNDVIGHDPEYAMAFIRAYNSYIAEISAQYRSRLYGVAILNFWDPEVTADHLAEIKDQGLKAITIPTTPPGVSYNDPRMEPMWDAIEASGLPLSFHPGEKFIMNGPGVMGTNLMVQFHPFLRLWSLLAFSGILERHPEMPVVFVEGQLNWIPGTLSDADAFYRSFGSVCEPKLAHPPSYYWHQNCYASFQEDPVGLEMLHHIGWDRALFATDYPHAESTVGRVQAAAQAVVAATKPEEAKAILGGTAIKLWGLDEE